MKQATLNLTPVTAAGVWSGFDIDLSYDYYPITAGDPLFAVPQIVASIPGAPYTAEDFTVSDELGSLTIRELPVHEGIGGLYRSWAADRATQGAIRVRVFAPVREIDKHTPVGPLFDLRAEELGLFGAGISFLPLPQATTMPSFSGEGVGAQYSLQLRWHGAESEQTISSRGLGDQDWEGELQSLAFTYYGAGTPISVPGDDSPFGLHSFAPPPFSLDEVAEYLRDLFFAMSTFFEDLKPAFRMLIRKNPSAGTGGTALPGSFAFGFSATEASDPDDLRSLLAHEMTHNWPHLDDNPDLTSWYSEGMAEYYSHVIPLRAGLLSRERFAMQLTDRARDYGTNPLRTLSNAEANKRAWIDPRSQRVPYGRGLNYFIATNAAIRAATNGEKSLDDIAVGIVRSQRAGERVTIDGWVERLSEALGQDARDEFEAMAAGKPIALDGLEFEGCVAVGDIATEFNLGFDITSFKSEGRIVRGVEPGAPAAMAGLRNGDALVAQALPYHLLRRSDRMLQLEISRDGQPHVISYAAVGDEVPVVRWEPRKG